MMQLNRRANAFAGVRVDHQDERRTAVKHGILVVAAAAIVLGGLAGCSNNKSSTGSSTTTSSSAPGSSASSSAPTGSPNAGSAQYKITVNGQAVTNAGNGVSCGPSESGPGFVIRIGAPDPSGRYFDNWVEITNETPPKVARVDIVSDARVAYNFGSSPGPGGSGDAQVNKSDKTYKISGHITPVFDKRTRTTYNNAPPVPFEFDATCP
jgi:ipoprotein LpqH